MLPATTPACNPACAWARCCASPATMRARGVRALRGPTARAGMTWEATIARADHAVCLARLGRCSMPTRAAPWPRPSWNRASPTMRAPSHDSLAELHELLGRAAARAPCRTGARRLGLRPRLLRLPARGAAGLRTARRLSPPWMRLCHRRDSRGRVPPLAGRGCCGRTAPIVSAGSMPVPEAAVHAPHAIWLRCLPREVIAPRTSLWFNLEVSATLPRQACLPVLRPRRSATASCATRPSPSPVGCRRGEEGRSRRAVHAELPAVRRRAVRRPARRCGGGASQPDELRRGVRHYITDPETKVTICSADPAASSPRRMPRCPRRSACSTCW